MGGTRHLHTTQPPLGMGPLLVSDHKKVPLYLHLKVLDKTCRVTLCKFYRNVRLYFLEENRTFNVTCYSSDSTLNMKFKKVLDKLNVELNWANQLLSSLRM